MTRIVPILACIALSGCAILPWRTGDRPEATAQDTGATRPEARPAAATPPAGARTAEALDTSTDADRGRAASAPATDGALLGEVVVSLGDVSEPGFWLVTPLVDRAIPGRAVAADGTGVQLELRPAGAGAGSRISLAAMRLLGIPLTDLATLRVLAEP